MGAYSGDQGVYDQLPVDVTHSDHLLKLMEVLEGRADVLVVDVLLRRVPQQLLQKRAVNIQLYGVGSHFRG